MTIYDESVFINCPFDPKYERRLFYVLIFTVQYCGFLPRSAKEISDGAQNRLDKIYKLIEACRHGIHDISWTHADEKSGLPRFNMPFELGLYLGATRFGGKNQRLKKALVLDTERYRFQSFLSDLAGIDPSIYHNEPLDLTRVVRKWFVDLTQRSIPGPSAIMRDYEKFQVRLPDLARALDLQVDEISYTELLNFGAAFLVELGREANTLPKP